MRKNKSLYDSGLIKFDSISGEISCTSKIDALNFEVGSLKSEVGSRKSEVGSRKSEVGSRKSEVGSRKSEVGSRKSLLGFRIQEMYKYLLKFEHHRVNPFFFKIEGPKVKLALKSNITDCCN